jgi:hypothetical protein
MSAKSSTLSHRGWDRWDLGTEFGIDETGANFQALRTAYDDLPEDPYALGSGRFRRYARGIFLPWSKEFFWMPATKSQSHEATYGYYQGDNNPEFVNITRNLRAISEEACNNKILLDIIQFDFSQTRWNEDDAVWPLHVGVHLIKLHVAEGGRDAVSSPDELHQDGEPYTFAHLIYRDNAEGGVNLIATPEYQGKQPEDVAPADRLVEFQMERPLETYAITDHLVSHYVGPIRKGDADRPGERAVLLVDWVPMRHRI